MPRDMATGLQDDTEAPSPFLRADGSIDRRAAMEHGRVLRSRRAWGLLSALRRMLGGRDARAGSGAGS